MTPYTRGGGWRTMGRRISWPRERSVARELTYGSIPVNCVVTIK